MKLLAFIMLPIISFLAAGFFPDHSAIVVISLMFWGCWVLYIIYLYFKRDSKSKRPPTDRQHNFIDALLREREVEPWMLEKEPKNVKEASKFIAKLLNQPERNERVRAVEGAYE